MNQKKLSKKHELHASDQLFLEEQKGILRAYVRITSMEPNVDCQVKEIEKYLPGKIAELYVETEPNKTLEDQPKLAQLIKKSKRGDKIIVSSLDCLCSSMNELIKLLTVFQDIGIGLMSIEDSDYFDGSSNKEESLGLIKLIKKFDQRTRRQKQQHGINKRKSEGGYPGRSKKLKPSNFDECYIQWLTAIQDNSYTLADFCKDTHLEENVLWDFILEQRKLDLESE